MYRLLLSRTIGSVGVLLGAIAVAIPGLAASTCAGNIQSTLLHPLPKSMVVTGDSVSVANSGTPELTRRFVDGLQQSGVTVADHGNVTLNITAWVTSPPRASKIVTGQYRDFDWIISGRVSTGQRASDIRSASLSMTAVLVDNEVTTQSWVATIKCRVATDDAEALAGDLGRIIGRAFGTDGEKQL